jgi:predicted dehydrogenase
VARLMRESGNVEYVAVADVYLPNAERARELAGHRAACVQDFRKLLDSQDIDAVHIATPDHWHAIATVLACEAGKDVYVEKPTALTAREGHAMVKAARKHNRIVQVGTQHRSAPHFRRIAEMIARGDIGKVAFVRMWNYANHTPKGIGHKGNQQPPEGLDWDMYLGPSPQVPFNPNRFLVNYRYFWDYSGGYITDFGNHRIDTMQQIMGVSAPRSVCASGGNFAVQDDRETPDFLTVTYEYDGFIAVYEGSNVNEHGLGGRTPGHKYYNARGEFDQPNGIAFYGTDGTIYAERIGWEMFPEPVTPFADDSVRARRANVKRSWENVEEPTRAHAVNFIDCVRSRQLPNADVEIGHRSTTAALLGNIAFRTGRKLGWDAAKEDFVDAPEASTMLTRSLRKPWDLIRL